uniref:Delta-6 desaturase-related protein n=1 Tax=Echium pitardii var. pitardii TaxID=174255 RepID=Q20KN9_9BORA|nr:delta-6 desaturase-related protein [Echium pitardii var. pitardii]
MDSAIKKYITTDELKKHDKPDDLWISIQGKIYDVSNWLKDHPGGHYPLTSLAGQDVTDAFVAFHPASAWQNLDEFFNGYYLKDYYVSDVSKDYRKLVSEFSKMGLFKKNGHTVFVTLSLIAMSFAMSVYGVLFCQGVLVHWLCGCLVGILWTQCGLLGHDAGHYTMMPSSRLNKFVFILAANCLSGVSIGWWTWNHNAHHVACNSLEYDPDVQYIPFIVVSSKLLTSLTSHFHEKRLKFDSLSKFFVSHQHWTFYPVMCSARLYLIVQSFIMLLTKRNVSHRSQELFGLIVFWIWYPFLVYCLPNWSERIMFVLPSFFMTGIQQLQFSLSHVSSSVYVGKPKGNDWFEKQTSGTLDISCPSWMDWFYGGTQFQIEHHLFPRLPRCHFRTISPLVMELCKKHNLNYNCASFFKGNKMVIKTLKKAALEARDLAKPKNLECVGVNTHAQD